jgi:uncharacterized protein (TIGR03437 family)
VVNAASGIQSPLPNSGIAQGAIFLILGSNLGPAALSLDNSPFTSTRLLGTSVSVTVKGTTVSVLMYYTSATQVAGLLPSNTPVGTGTITVTYNNVTSAPAPITVVQNNLGVFTLTSDGTGAGIVTYADYSLVSPSRAANCGGPNTTCGAANSGDVLILWATGLGPVSAPDSSGPQPGNMASVPLKLWLGGVQATVTYQGRSGCCIGEDQVVFTVPSNVPTGCAVPLAVQINDQISNYTVMAVASGSRTCTPATPYFAASAIALVSSGSPVTYSQIKLNRRFTNRGAYEDRGDAKFTKVSLPAALTPFAVTILDGQPAGTCIVANTFQGSNPPFTFLGAPDAGPSLTVKGSNGSKTLVKQSGQGPTDYFTVLGPADYLTSGTFTITGTGGASVGAFTATLNLTTLPVWTNQSSLSTVNRANGLTVTWTGGAPNTYVQLFGESATDKNFTSGALFACSAPATAGTLTVPPSVLQTLPAGPNGALSFSLDATPTTFTASGLDLGFVTSNRETVILVTFQ